MVVVVREQQPGLLLVTDETIDLLQKIPPLHGDAHVGDYGKHLFAVLFSVAQGLLYRFFFEVQLQRNGIAVCKNGVTLLLQQAGQRGGVRPLGDGGVHIAVVVKNGQPCAHAVRLFLDKAGVDLVPCQLVDDVLSHAGVIHQTHKGGAQLYVGDILHHVAAYTAVYLLDASGVAPAGDIGGKGIALDIHKNSSDDYDAHKR